MSQVKYDSYIFQSKVIGNHLQSDENFCHTNYNFKTKNLKNVIFFKKYYKLILKKLRILKIGDKYEV